MAAILLLGMLLTAAAPIALAAPYTDLADTQQAADMLAHYAPYGLARRDNGRLYYSGQLVRSFDYFDPSTGAAYIDRSGGEIDLYRAYDVHGNFMGIGVYSQAEFNRRTDAWLEAAYFQRGSFSANPSGDWRYAYGISSDSDAGISIYSEWGAQAEIEADWSVDDSALQEQAKEAWVALDSFLGGWKAQDYGEMAAYVMPIWVNAQQSHKAALRARFGELQPTQWVIASSPASYTANEMYFDLLLYVTTGKGRAQQIEERLYTVLVCRDADGNWYVDPENWEQDPGDLPLPTSTPAFASLPAMEPLPTERPASPAADALVLLTPEPTPAAPAAGKGDNPIAAIGEKDQDAVMAAIDSFFQCWRDQDFASMLALTTPAWRADHSAQDLAMYQAQQLIDWSYLDAYDVSPKGITIVVEVETAGAEQSKPEHHQYNVRLQKEKNDWYVDPEIFPSEETALPLEPEGEISLAFEMAVAVLNNYMQCWQEQDYEKMTALTTPNWRSQQNNPLRQLAWNHGGWIVDEWVISGTELAATADTITLTATVGLYKNTSSKDYAIREYSAILFCVDGEWYVDPDSLRTGLDVDAFPQTRDIG